MVLDEVKNLNHSDDFIFAVAVGQVREYMHCALLYKWDDQIKTIDLVDQVVRKNGWSIGDFGHRDFLYVKYNQDIVLDAFALQVPSVCELIKSKHEKINFGIKFSETRFDDEGELIFANGDFGLTCATFVLAILEQSFGQELIDQSTWQSRKEDGEWQQRVLEYYKKVNSEEPGYYDNNLIPHYEKNIGCFRFRPEEVGAATSADILPSEFSYCEEFGRRLKDALDYGIETYNKTYLTP
jgi:hypothetical protein